MKTHSCTLTKIYIVEDSALIRHALIELLSELQGVRIVGEADNPTQAITGIMETQPDCVVLDFQLIGGTGVEVIRNIHPLNPDIAFLVMTNHPNSHYRQVCMEAGASEFFDKSKEFEKLREVISHLAAAS